MFSIQLWRAPLSLMAAPEWAASASRRSAGAPGGSTSSSSRGRRARSSGRTCSYSGSREDIRFWRWISSRHSTFASATVFISTSPFSIRRTNEMIYTVRPWNVLPPRRQAFSSSNTRSGRIWPIPPASSEKSDPLCKVTLHWHSMAWGNRPMPNKRGRRWEREARRIKRRCTNYGRPVGPALIKETT